MSLPAVTFDDLQAAFRLVDFDHTPAHMRMAPNPRGLRMYDNGAPPREAGVLALIYPEAGALRVILTRRTDTLRGHSGQISFPGGQRDLRDESFTATALRETYEELGISPGDVAVIGHLSPIYIPPSHYNVYPTVGYLPSMPAFQPNSDEVAEILSFALDDLLDPHYRREEEREFQGFRAKIPYYQVAGHKVWGATAVMLSELEARLRTALQQRMLNVSGQNYTPDDGTGL